jgi:hypothetical protein
MGVRECKSEFVGSSGTCFKSRRRHGEREPLLASSAARVAARAAAARRGGVGVVSRVVNGGRGAGGARGAEKSGAGQVELGNMAGKGGRVGRREKQREEGLEVDDED